MIIPEKEIEQVKAWKKIPKPKIRQYYCPFHVSKAGGKICAKAFKRCKHNPDARLLKLIDACGTTPCPCQTYKWCYVMMQANKIIKYGRI